MIFPAVAFFATAAKAVAAWASASALNSFLANTALAVGANILASKLAGKQRPKRPQIGFTGRIGQGGVVPRSFILGRYATAGSLVYHNSWGEASGTPNAYYTRVIALSDLPVNGLAGVWMNGERVTLGAPEDADKGFPIVELTNTFNVDEIGTTTISQPVGGTATVPDFSTIGRTTTFGWIKFYDGTQSAADSFLSDDVGTTERPWDSNAVGTGVAYVVVTLRYNTNWMANPLGAEFLFEVDGIDIDDPAGGSTAADQNPIRQIHHLVKGISYGGAPFYGPSSDQTARLNLSELAAEAAKCDAPVPGTAGLTNAQKIERFGSTTVPPRYRASAEVSVDVALADLIPDLLGACAGTAAVTATGYRFRVGEPGSPVLSFDDDDVLTTAPQSFTPILSLADTVNAVTAEYPEPDEGWQLTDAPPLYDSALEAEDGGRRLPTRIDMPAAPYREQVQRLMATALRVARRARRNSLVLRAAMWGLEPGDVVSFSSSRNGYAGKLFLTDGVVDQGDGNLRVDLTEIDPDDYDWDADADYTAPARGSVARQPLTVIAVPGWSVTGVVLADGGDQGRAAALLIGWDGEMEDTRSIDVEVRLAGTTRVIATRTFTGIEAAGAIISGSAIQGGKTYEARGRVNSVSPRITAWTSWTSATTPAVPLAAETDLNALFDALDITSVKLITGITNPALVPPPANELDRFAYLVDTKQFIEWNGSAWVVVTTDVSDLVGEFSSAEVNDRFAAKTIFASKFVATDLTNLIRDPEFLTDEVWEATSGIFTRVTLATGESVYRVEDVSGGTPGTFAGDIVQLVRVDSLQGQPVNYSGMIHVFSGGTARGAYSVRAAWLDATETLIGVEQTLTNATAGSEIDAFSEIGRFVMAGKGTVPDDAIWLRLRYRAAYDASGNLRKAVVFRNPWVRRANNAEMIVDGGITAGEIVATGTITSPLFQAGAVDAAAIRTDVAVITTTAQIATALVDTIHVKDLFAERAKIAGGAVSTTRSYEPAAITAVAPSAGTVLNTFSSFTTLNIGDHYIVITGSMRMNVIDDSTSSVKVALDYNAAGAGWVRRFTSPLYDQDDEGDILDFTAVVEVAGNVSFQFRLVVADESSLDEFELDQIYILINEETGK